MHTFKSFVRGIRKSPLISLINLLGLSLGLASGVLVMVYATDELAYDQFHKNKDRIYRIGTDIFDVNSGEQQGAIETNGWPVGDRLKNTYPEIEELVYARNASYLYLTKDGKRINQRIFFASDGFFRMFSFELKKGNPEKLLTDDYSLVITESMEKKYFGEENALGKTIALADTLLFKVTGVIADLPDQSHIQFDMLCSFSTYKTAINPDFNFDYGWGNINVRNYLMLKEGVDHQEFIRKASRIYMDEQGEWFSERGMELIAAFEPLTDIYLKTDRGNGFGTTGSLDRVYLVISIAVFVILIACINFINLATARSFNRAKEVGLRKVVGSTRKGLVKQFLLESLLFTTTAFMIGIGLLDLSLPFFNQLLNKDYTLQELFSPNIIIGILVLIPLVSVLAGYYPGLVLSRFQPAQVLKTKISAGKHGSNLRRSLVVIQFMLAISLITGTLIVTNQLDYMKNRDLGFKKDPIIVINAGRVDRTELDPKAEVFKQELSALTEINNVSHTWSVPGRQGWPGQWAFPEGFPDGESVSVEYIPTDEHYVQVLGLELIAGRNFDPERQSDLDEGLILNETAVTIMNWGTPENAIGKTITSPSGYPAGTVIGVVKNFNQLGLQNRIGPIVIDYNPDRNSYFALQVETNDRQRLLADLEGIWNLHFEGFDFDYFYLKDDFERQYRQEETFSKVFTAFSFITIFIAVIGLFGLVSFIINAKAKEIGIRKVLGAHEVNITLLLSREFILLIIIANIIMIPVSWLFADRWLENFAYKMTIQPSIFIIGFAMTLLVTLASVSVQTIRAARVNPTETLRSE